MELMAGAPKNLADVRMQFRDVLDGIMSIPRVLSNPVRTGACLTVREKRIGEELAWDKEKDRRREAKKTALVAHPLVFRPSISGTGKWHVAYSENKYVYPPSDGLNVKVRPSCGARRVQLDRVATPLKLVVDSSRNEYAAQCCSRCLEYSDQTYSSVHQYPIPKIDPKERWRFLNPRTLARSGTSSAAISMSTRNLFRVCAALSVSLRVGEALFQSQKPMRSTHVFVATVSRL
jgi:predicted nucleic-acid-binding Zn-ribbon protein